MLKPLFVALAGVAAFGLLAPASAQRGSQPVRIDYGGNSAVSKSIVLPLNKAAIVELPQAASDVLVSAPSVVDAVVRSPRRVYLLGLTTGQTNAFFFDSRGRQILNLEIVVERDMDALAELLSRVMPDSRIEIDAVNDNVVLKGVVQSAAEAANASDLAGRFVGNPEQVINMLTVRDPGQVMLKVRIVEMQRQLLKQLGVAVSGSIPISNSAFTFAAQNAIATNGGVGLSGSRPNPGGTLQNLNASFSGV